MTITYSLSYLSLSIWLQSVNFSSARKLITKVIKYSSPFIIVSFRDFHHYLVWF